MIEHNDLRQCPSDLALLNVGKPPRNVVALIHGLSPCRVVISLHELK